MWTNGQMIGMMVMLAVVLSVGYLLIWNYARCQYNARMTTLTRELQADQNRQEESLRANESHYTELQDSLRNLHKQRLDGLTAKYQNAINEFGAWQLQQCKARDLLIRGCIQFLVRSGKLNDGSALGERACVLLHYVNALGFFSVDADTARLVAKGQLLSQTRPCDVQKALHDLADKQAAAEKADAEARAGSTPAHHNEGPELVSTGIDK